MLRKGRFEESADQDAAEYSSSLEDDNRLFESVLHINIAHVQMLIDCGIIKKGNGETIIDSLQKLREEGIEALELGPEVEDIHMAIESYVNQKAGEEVGGKMHTAKSRNDQVATAIRMVLREEILNVQKELIDLISSLVDKAEKNLRTIMPGYTHLQVAEPTTFAHYLLSHAEEFLRDLKRLDTAFIRTNQCPQGACAFAGTSFPIEREETSKLLGFNKILENTMDSVSSRDFAIETMSCLSILVTNVSRICEELVIWNSAEFDMIKIPEKFLSTSSIMPQKKNPEVAELGRAKSGTIVGNLIGGLKILKSIPQAYNLDLQELTPHLWGSVDETKDTIRIMNKIFNEIKPNAEKMEANLNKGFPTATELANTLVREEGLSFREAHRIVGEFASKVDKENTEIADISIEDLNSIFKSVTGDDVSLSKRKLEKAIDPSKNVEKKKVKGGPSPKRVKNEIKNLKREIETEIEILNNRKESLKKTRDNLIQLGGD
ncbi:MAG: argininosuccinate lyase [Candidatus Hadarchaeia archaeon]